MNVSETPEQRRARLKALAQARVGRLVGGEDVQPHMDIAEMRRLTEAQAAETMATLLDQRAVDFPVRAHRVQVALADETRSPGRHLLIFAVQVDGAPLDEVLMCDALHLGRGFAFEVPKALQHRFGSEAVWGDTPYDALFRVVGDSSFPAFLESLTSQCAAQEAARDQAIARIVEEVGRFRDVLVRKYRQLTYQDEYETLEVARFRDEARRFAGKRLADLPVEAVVDVLVELVGGWAAEDGGEAVAFDPGMSPLDYERFCAALFERVGWTARLTRASGDQGADILCEANGRRLVVQCKLYSSSVGNAAVQEVVAAREYEYADLATVVSNAAYTTAARELASATGVLLLHHDEIAAVTP
ncbi:restriction endonuclease [Azospirillum ramasamyi]|uniref:Restriction endonuclease type IV Mrr domain-containing protein n=1 Tax=Azospirillum ramasamyi TaxID=682998 RepID=A0A2U9SHD3_9PROT|nr:restriction endonuclease [Azospirillum ramasamyi]AWU98096.1 hypothetical protein DM194_27815 [Azospirillum ramasamyi]